MTQRIKLEGKTFGELYVEKYIGNSKYHCICSCKKEVDVFASNLTRHHTTTCGHIKIHDLTGKVVNNLQVIERSENRIHGNESRVMWKCRCRKCGNITDVRADSLASGITDTCGCSQFTKDIPEKMRKDFVNGTQLSKIQSKTTAANKSGVVGVNWDKSRNKWQASIRFQGHKYNLGRFEDIDDAIKARKEAEKKYFKGVLENESTED